MIELIGWISAIFLAICGIPQAYSSWKHGHSIGISKLFLWFWFGGEVTGLVYVIYQGNPPLIANYGLNTIFVGIILFFSCFPRNPMV